VDESIRLEPIGGHLVHIPVQVGTSAPTRMILDTGIGLTLLSTDLCARAGGHLTGETYTGKRMSGQEIPVPLARVPSLNLGTYRVDDALVGVFAPGLIPREWGFVEGFVSPGFFGEIPFTIRRTEGTLTLEREVPSREAQAARTAVPVSARRSGPELTLFVDLTLPNGHSVKVEVDTGSGNLILEARFFKELGIRDDAPGVQKAEGVDETGHAYVRYQAPLPGRIVLGGVDHLSQRDPVAIFQTIIHDGLLGDDFLRRFDVTYDIAGSQMLFAFPRT
jgi:hypothetical protein